MITHIVALVAFTSMVSGVSVWAWTNVREGVKTSQALVEMPHQLEELVRLSRANNELLTEVLEQSPCPE